MKSKIISYFICPLCGSSFTFTCFKEKNKEIFEGLFICNKCGEIFPVVNYVPNFLIGKLKNIDKNFCKKYGLNIKPNVHPQKTEGSEAQVQKSFGNKWQTQPQWGIGGETEKFMKEWKLKKYGWENNQGYQDYLKDKEFILDAGAGLARDAIDLAENSSAQVFGVELSDCAKEAYQNVLAKNLENCHIIQGDILNLPFKKKFFNLIFTEGVLHHTKSTEKAFKYLVNFLSKKGEIAVYIYKKKGPIREFCDDYIRAQTTGMSEEECWRFSEKITKLGRVLSELNIEFEIPENIEILKIKKGKYNLQRFFYWHILKCFWNAQFSFDENNLINFDWYHPKDAHRHTKKEITKWCRDCNLDLYYLNAREQAAWVFRARKM